jgi:hypothetical protein
MMECLPAKGWQTLQRRYYQEQNICKSSRRWIRGVLKQLQNLGHQQWKHRCDVKANITRPQEKEHIDIMHDEIEEQFVIGNEDLLPGDKSILDYSILNLLQRSLAYKKGWLTRVWAARQRAQRIALGNDDIIVQTKEAECLIKWMKHHRDRPRRKVRRPQQTTDDEVMEETEDQQNNFISDSEYLAANVSESMEQVMDGNKCYMDEELTETLEAPKWMDLAANVSESMEHVMDGNKCYMDEELTETLEAPKWMDISAELSCVNQGSGFGGPQVNDTTPCNLIVRNP